MPREEARPTAGGGELADQDLAGDIHSVEVPVHLSTRPGRVQEGHQLDWAQLAPEEHRGSVSQRLHRAL